MSALKLSPAKSELAIMDEVKLKIESIFGHLESIRNTPFFTRHVSIAITELENVQFRINAAVTSYAAVITTAKRKQAKQDPESKEEQDKEVSMDV